MAFIEKLTAAWGKNNSLVCVGLDPDLAQLPAGLKDASEPFYEFNKAIIDATADAVCAFKLNSAMYEAQGSSGIDQLQKSCAYIAQKYPDIPILLDYKRGDIGNTNNYYAAFAFDYLGVDAITISPYMGKEANQAYLSYKDKGIMVLCRTSNPGAGEFQDLETNGKKLYQVVAEHVVNEWNDNNNCLLVVGATYPDELGELRKLTGDDMTFLVPGAGAQAGEVGKTVRAGINSLGTGLIINSSRGIIFASKGNDFAEAARAEALKMRDEINKYRK